MNTADKLIRIADSMSEDIAELESANRELKWQHVTVSDDLAHARERVAELERREALLTAFASAFGAAWTEARFPSESPVEEHIEKLNVLRAETYRRFDALTEAASPSPSRWTRPGACSAMTSTTPM